MGNQPSIGPGKTEMCQRCVIKLDVAHQIAEEVERHPEIINGNGYLRDLMKIWGSKREET